MQLTLQGNRATKQGVPAPNKTKKEMGRRQNIMVHIKEHSVSRDTKQKYDPVFSPIMMKR